MSSHDKIVVDPRGQATEDDIALSAFGPDHRVADDGVREKLFADDTVIAWVAGADYLDDHSVDWSSYPYAIIFRSRDYDAQNEAARAVYDRLVERTPWALILAFDELLDVEARRPALERA